MSFQVHSLLLIYKCYISSSHSKIVESFQMSWIIVYHTLPIHTYYLSKRDKNKKELMKPLNPFQSLFILLAFSVSLFNVGRLQKSLRQRLSHTVIGSLKCERYPTQMTNHLQAETKQMRKIFHWTMLSTMITHAMIRKSTPSNA